MPKPTVHDIAQEAGVSLATVDRVLNERPGVRDRTIQRVRAAIDKLGYVRDTYAANLARQKAYTFVFVLPEGPSSFIDVVREAIEEASTSQMAERVTIRVLSVPQNDPHGVVRRLLTLNPGKIDGVAIMAPETPQVRDAVRRLKNAGLAVATLFSDLPVPVRDHYVGINSYSAGRTAALLMGRFLRGVHGSVMVVTGSLQARDSIERRHGFDEVMQRDFPDLTVLPTLEFHDDISRVDRLVGTVASQTRDLAGVYSMGAGNQALLAALRKTDRLNEMTVIAHELTAVTREGLLAGEVDAVIAQNVGHLVRSAVRVLRAKCDSVDIFAAQEKIRIDIVTRENLP
ncbi:LacI family DNA-binding transcriptional regulator [Hwanghaeella grinnelliae]|uniref:LacI family DNA-binding transcriptional regulator n=1 Tax=Hwanghaeella grinnelliae TaxID=2500179 RepID=A0A3S2W2A0_9PROT|nr:LacI family DNA-binding transcriptional regulator [Hwanghaeella grinnelliae]RVU33989.1 LacI family DNA-binding transcriptional regulator [Hwanghaeella grinnelliae]